MIRQSQRKGNSFYVRLPSFLGLPLSDSYRQKLDAISPSLKALFIQEQSSDYLLQVDFQGVTYLGKYLETPYEMSALDSLQTHIYSLLQKLLPEVRKEEQTLLLLALPPRQAEG